MYNSSMIALILLSISCAFGADVSPADDQGAPACLDDRRTVLNILWSCLATIFASTWLAIHPNVPGTKITDKGAISRAVERAKIMSISIVAPEVIVAWAAEQFKVAWKVCHGGYFLSAGAIRFNMQTGKEISVASIIYDWRNGKNKDRQGLTMTHGFFLAMGGFCYTNITCSTNEIQRTASALHGPDDTHGPVTVHSRSENIVTLAFFEGDQAKVLVEDVEAISVKTIEDKSKGDALSKAISILQISWFIAQCVGRVIQHLPITLLELTAVAFAGISVITYCLWWYKPLNVQYHISLDGSMANKYLGVPKIKYDSRLDRPAGEIAFMLLQRLHRRVQAIHWLQWFLKGVLTTIFTMEPRFGRDGDTEDGVLRFSSGRGNIEWFGSHGTPKRSFPRFMAMVVVGSVFGGFISMGSSFYFPSPTEMLLWRVSCVVIFVGLIAAFFLPNTFLIAYRNDTIWARELVDPSFTTSTLSRNTWSFVESILTVISCFGTIAYIVGRMTLVILAFMQLRSLPPLAFHTVQWTAYIPHL